MTTIVDLDAHCASAQPRIPRGLSLRVGGVAAGPKALKHSAVYQERQLGPTTTDSGDTATKTISAETYSGKRSKGELRF